MSSKIDKAGIEKLFNTIVEMLDKEHPNEDNQDRAIKLIEDAVNNF